MAKRRRRAKTPINRTAENIGAALGQVAARLNAWYAQREDIAREIREVMAVGQRMLADLGPSAGGRDVLGAWSPARAGRAPGRPKGRKQSAAARAKMRAAWARRKAGKKKRNVSPEVRAKLARLAKERWAKAKRAGKTSLG